MQVIYTITGGDWLADSLNAVAVLTASATWGTLIKWASIPSVLAVIWSWLQKKDVPTFIKWVAVIVIVPGYTNSVIEKVYKNILFQEVERCIKGKVHPNALSKVAGGIATGVLTETLSSGRADLFSYNLILAAMSIADSHLANFEQETIL